MKGCIYLVLIVAFLMYYQQNPVFVIVILSIGLGGYVLVKRRNSSNPNTRTGFFKGNRPQGNSGMSEIMTLLMLQQTITPQENSYFYDTNDEEQNQIEQTKQEILELLDED